MPADGPLLLGIDQGTSATKVVAIAGDGRVVAAGQAPVTQRHPAPGWVEQSATELWDSVGIAVARCLQHVDAERVVAVGLSTQRESLVAWDRATGAPLGPVLGWQDRRSRTICARLIDSGAGEGVMALSGLPVDPMFSAAKASWMLDEIDPDRTRSRRGEIRLGTVDSWLLSRLGGPHTIEVGNASRTQLLHIQRRTWDPALLELFNVPAATLPQIVASTGPFPAVRGLAPLPDGLPVTGVAGDSHAALFANAGWQAGRTKISYGTGTSVMGMAGEAVPSGGLCLTIAWDTGDPAYALEGNIRSSGATIVWLADLLGLSVEEVATLAATGRSGGVHLVPAFTGLGAPWWDNQATGLVEGLSPGSGRAALARAAVEAVAFQIEDVVAAVASCAGPVTTLLADGGGSTNAALMQLQADTSGRTVVASHTADLSALGAAHLAGVGAGVWDLGALEVMERAGTTYTPAEDEVSRSVRLAAWHAAVRRCLWRDGMDG